MKYLLAMAVLLAGLGYPLSLRAQRLGGVRSFAPARGGFAIHAVRPVAGFARVTRPKAAPGQGSTWHSGGSRTPHHYQLNAGYWPGTPCITNPGYANSFFCRQYLPRQNVSSVVPYYGLPLWYGLTTYPSEAEAPTPVPVVPEENAALAGEVERLAEEVEMLRQERISAAAPPSPAAAAPVPQEVQPSTVLVYRDGHKDEAKNYAVLGQTLYVFEDETTRRIPFADLDLAATQKLNEERGVEFVPPARP